MACATLGDRVVICCPDPSGWRKRYWRCPICECITETVAQVELWYGMSVVCCRCGDSWHDGWLTPRPLVRYWRRDAAHRARQLWDRAAHGPFPTLHQLDPHMFPEEDGRPLADVDNRGALVEYDDEPEDQPPAVVTVRATGDRL